MPELPEVETVKRGLNKYLVGHTIIDVDLHTPKVFTGNPKDLIGGKIKVVRRFAKVLSIDLSNGYSIVIHIKLTGQLIYRGPNLSNPPQISKKVQGLGDKHTHVIFKLDKNGLLYYNDVRKFGWIKVIKTTDVEKSSFIGKLGPEPFGKLTKDLFKNIVSKPKTPIKVVIMDQEKIGGVGNIYANDALLLSKIHPKRPASSLTSSEQETLYDNILKVLKKGIESGGASELSFVTAGGTEGQYQNHFIAYGKEGTICPICKKEKIEKIRVGGRGTYFCPNCQRIK
ncbi:MAG TPA: bifunctional DNA-formamidopyrimidine glycosylase/DNA-(apurinic or apyrimidinic site) lyase [Patescibacteria group bacterium]